MRTTVFLTVLLVSSVSLADDPRVSDRKEKPRCSNVCETERYCAEQKPHCDLSGCCARWETRQICRQVCN